MVGLYFLDLLRWGWGHESSSGQWVVNRNYVRHFQTRAFSCPRKTSQFPFPLTDDFQCHGTESLPTHEDDEHALRREISLCCYKPRRLGSLLHCNITALMQTGITTISWQKFGVPGVLLKGPPCGERGKKVHLGPPLTTKNKEVGQHVSQETLMWPWWLSTARVTPQGLTPHVLCSSTWPSLEGGDPLEYMDKMLWIPRTLSFQPSFSERFSIPLLSRILPDKISSLQSDPVLWLMRFSNHEKLMVSDKHALSMYPQQRMAKSTSSLTWYCQGKLMGQFGKPVFSYTGYYQSPLLTSFSRSYLAHSFLPDSIEPRSI